VYIIAGLLTDCCIGSGWRSRFLRFGTDLGAFVSASALVPSSAGSLESSPQGTRSPSSPARTNRPNLLRSLLASWPALLEGTSSRWSCLPCTFRRCRNSERRAKNVLLHNGQGGEADIFFEGRTEGGGALRVAIMEEGARVNVCRICIFASG
jgi:hypothetical protein